MPRNGVVSVSGATCDATGDLFCLATRKPIKSITTINQKRATGSHGGFGGSIRGGRQPGSGPSLFEYSGSAVTAKGIVNICQC